MKSKLLFSIAFSSLIFIFAPLLTYLNNILEIEIGFSEILGYVLIFLVCFGVLFAILHFLPKKISKIVASILLAILIIIFVEGNFVNYKFGVLNGAVINWHNYRLAVNIELFSNIFLILLSGIFYKKVYKNLSKVSALILLLSITFCSLGFYKNVKDGVFASKKNTKQEIEKVSWELENKYLFSRKDNVLILVLDAFSSELFEEVMASDNGADIKKTFKDFTFFKNNVGLFPTTCMSVPYIRSGQMYDNSIPRDEFEKKNEKYLIENKLTDRKTTVSLSDFNKKRYNLGSVTKLRFAPVYIKKYIHNYNSLYGEIHPDLPYYENISKIYYTDEKVFKYLHLFGMHEPWRMNKNVSANFKASYQDTAIANLKIISKILDSLKKEGVYDNSLIFVVGDHGAKRMTETGSKYQTPLMLVKNYNAKQDALAVDLSNVTLGDIPNTIFTALNKPLNPYGENLFALKNNKDRVLKYCDYAWEDNYWRKNYLPKMTCYNVKDRKLLK